MLWFFGELEFFGVKFPQCQLTDGDRALLWSIDELRNYEVNESTGFALPFLSACKLACIPTGAPPCCPQEEWALVTPSEVIMGFGNLDLIAELAKTYGATANAETMPYCAAYLMWMVRVEEYSYSDLRLCGEMTADEVRASFESDDPPLSYKPVGTAWRARAYRKTADGTAVRLEANITEGGMVDEESVVTSSSAIQVHPARLLGF